MTRVRVPHLLLMSATLVLGLAADVRTGVVGQILIGAAFWGVLFYLCSVVEPRERKALIVCLAVATAGELFLSLAWGVYTYRLENVPLFVPPGHVLMFMLATGLARRMPELVARGIIACAAVYAIAAAGTGFDTFGVPLFLVLGVSVVALPRERRILAATLALSLALELYGTALGVWTWRHDVPFTPLVTTNPPALSGALYTVRDALVAVGALLMARRGAVAPSLGLVGPALKS